METLEMDLAVIGSGPAGQKGAVQGAKIGKKVILVDRDFKLGGACLHHGTIPSKTLREAVLDLTGFRQRSYYGRSGNGEHEISINDLNFRLRRVIEDQQSLIGRQMLKNKIDVVNGSARFVDPYTIKITDGDGQAKCLLRPRQVLIATGSRPRHPIETPFDDDTILDSDRLLRIDYLPKTMMVLGGGVIGCEYATMFAALGTKVTLIDQCQRPMPFLDAEISTRFVEYVQSMGVDFKFGVPIVEIGKSGKEQADVVLADGTVMQAQCLFVSLGRQANAQELGLENVGITLNERGYIPVNALFETKVPHIYAAGDVIGQPSLAATSMEQGRLAVRNAFSLKSKQFPEFFPYGIYTIPEISSVGPSEAELIRRGVHYQVGLAYYYEIGRGPIKGDNKGLFKIIFHAETLEVLAVHIIGTDATELIHIGQLAIDFRARVTYFVEQVFNYPTFAEGYRIAALNGLNKLKGSQVPRGWLS